MEGLVLTSHRRQGDHGGGEATDVLMCKSLLGEDEIGRRVVRPFRHVDLEESSAVRIRRKAIAALRDGRSGREPDLHAVRVLHAVFVDAVGESVDGVVVVHACRLQGRWSAADKSSDAAPFRLTHAAAGLVEDDLIVRPAALALWEAFTILRDLRRRQEESGDAGFTRAAWCLLAADTVASRRCPRSNRTDFLRHVLGDSSKHAETATHLGRDPAAGPRSSLPGSPERIDTHPDLDTGDWGDTCPPETRSSVGRTQGPPGSQPAPLRTLPSRGGTEPGAEPACKKAAGAAAGAFAEASWAARRGGARSCLQSARISVSLDRITSFTVHFPIAATISIFQTSTTASAVASLLDGSEQGEHGED
eukprot:scaffold2534_cov260-Pinguiococcus_pyrenoidosus.AAC.13